MNATTMTSIRPSLDNYCDTCNRKSVSYAVSIDAIKVQETLHEVMINLRSSFYLGKSLSDAIDALLKISQECKFDNWDGYGAKALSEEVFAEARCFIENLPLTAPPPELSIDPDGEIVFEWYAAPRKVFSVSVGVDRLTYAGLFGSSTIHGTEPFDNDIPKTILDNLYRVYM
jgi:hypothetical protein